MGIRRLKDYLEKVEFEIADYLRGRPDRKVTVRFCPNDTVELPCYLEYGYDFAMESDQTNKVLIPRKIEVKGEGGDWTPYPSASCVSRVHRTYVFVVKGGGVYIAASPEGLTDKKLLKTAKKVGICTEHY